MSGVILLAGPDRAQVHVGITQVDPKGTPLRRYRLVNAFASQWNEAALDGSEAGPATETVTIAYEDISVE